MIRRSLLLVAGVLALTTTLAQADDLMFRRVTRGFPETITQVQEVIRAHGYTVSRVQRVDVGLTSSGFQTAEYRLVFYGKAEEVHALSHAHPKLAAFLPLVVIVFAEGDETLLLATNPRWLARDFPDAELRPHFAQWSRDLEAILDEASAAP